MHATSFTTTTDKLLHHSSIKYPHVILYCILHETQAVADSMSAADEPYEGFANYYDYLSAMWVSHYDMLCMMGVFFCFHWH